MNEKTTYNNFHVRLSGTPEQFAAFLIDWCRDSYRIIGIVPRITFKDDGSIQMVEGVQAQTELLMTHTFDDAFEVLNGVTPDQLDLEPGYRYIHRTKGTVDGRWRQASQHHLPDKDFATSLCGNAQAGENGYEIVFKKERVLRSQRCKHCGTRRIDYEPG